MKKKYLMKCQKCGAILVPEGYHRYGWYLNGKRIEEGCPPFAELQGKAAKHSAAPKEKGRTSSRSKPAKPG